MLSNIKNGDIVFIYQNLFNIVDVLDAYVRWEQGRIEPEKRLKIAKLKKEGLKRFYLSVEVSLKGMHILAQKNIL